MSKKQKQFNRKISTDFALSLIAIAIISSSIVIWNVSNYESSVLDSQFASAAQVKKGSNLGAKKNCTPKYYDGDAVVKVWQKSIEKNGAILIQLTSSDMGKFPKIANTNDAPGSIVRLIDATSVIEKQLENSSEKNPLEITIKGFAQTCQGMLSVSLNPASSAFKKK
jgi:hypothetical protein